MVVSGARRFFLLKAGSALAALALAFAAACIVSAPAFASGWSIEATPTLSHDTLASALSAVSCPAAKTCFAVGHYVDTSGVQRPLIEAWNGSRWTIDQTPRLAGGGALDGVSCTSSTACRAVGDQVDSSGAHATLAEQWNGTAWSIESTPTIAGATSAELNDVSCPSASACMAVGYYVDSSGAQLLLAEAWNGSAWTIQTNGFAATGGDLTRISCSAPTGCTAIGGGTTQVERWNGADWTTQSLAVPSSPVSPSIQLHGVTCTGANLCTAVGHWSYSYSSCTPGGPPCRCKPFQPCYGHSGSFMLAEVWNGSGWAIEPGQGSDVLYGISCHTATDCTAVGSTGATAAVQWNGSTWSDQNIPSPEAGGTLQEVACTAAADCVAVGDSGSVTLAEGWNGTTWSIQPSPNPTGPPNPQLMGVSCPTATNCTAVGQYTADVGTSGPTQAPLGENWDGTSWKQQTVPNVDDWCESCFGLVSSLSSVSCTTANNCMAVGPSNSVANGPAAEEWNGTTWTVLTSINWDNLFGAPSGVSCLGPMCMAVGYGYQSLPGDEIPTAEMWDGSSWSGWAPILGGGPPAPAGASASALSSVSCPTTTDCTAVGNQTPSGPLAENWNGSTWTVQTTPGTASLTGVSCPTTDLCWAVGGTGSMVAEEWNGSAWTLQPLPAPTGATSTSLTGISCSSASDCVAVGYDKTSTGTTMTLAEHWDGTNWTIEPTPNPTNSTGSYLSAVSCTSATTCTAVGHYRNASNASFTLAEGYSG
jgi:hypothetical protein